MPYLKFLQLVDTVRQLPSYPAMDATEVQTLNALAQEWQIGNKVSVVQAMGMLPDIHRRWMEKQHAFLSLQAQASDAGGAFPHFFAGRFLRHKADPSVPFLDHPFPAGPG